MKISCVECKKYLGEIRDVKLRKNIVHLCRDCNIKRITKKIVQGQGSGKTTTLETLFGGR